MGQCCQKVGGTKQISDSGKQMVLLTKKQLKSNYNTSNDDEFTYFLGVFELLSLGEKLQLPECIDEMHPNFSYNKFNHIYNQYQLKIVHLGQFIQKYRASTSQLNQRIEADHQQIKLLRNHEKLTNFQNHGCLVKVQIQDVRWNEVKEVGVVLDHPLDWSSKYLKLFAKEAIVAGPVYVQFVVPEIKGAVVKIFSKPAKGEIVFNIEDCFKKSQQLFCKVMKWKGASQLDGVALRVQLISEDRKGEEQKFLQMVNLHQKLVKQYGVDGEIEVSLDQKQIGARLSRHRTSLNNKYNLNANQMF